MSAEQTQILSKYYGDQIAGSLSETGAAQALSGQPVTSESDRQALAEFLRAVCRNVIKERVVAVVFPDKRRHRAR